MASIVTESCIQVSSSALHRLNYFPRQLMTADDMRLEQEYFLEKLRRHNRFLHGSGVVCGLEVCIIEKLNISISPGYALDPYGNEIYIPTDSPFNLAPFVSTSKEDCKPCIQESVSLSSSEKAVFNLVVRYVECACRPVRVMPESCGCDEAACEYSRIQESYKIDCQPIKATEIKKVIKSPATQDEIRPIRRKQAQSLTCSPNPSDPWVVLAGITVDLKSVKIIKVNPNVRSVVPSQGKL
jgi:hypothetical protein